MTTSLTQEFRRLFSREPRLFRAPGRVNLIGEHTDYNDGFVMPAAIHFETWCGAAARNDRLVHVYSANLGESIEFSLDDAHAEPTHTWQDYVQGAALQIERAGHRLRGADLLIRSEIPLGAGLSSSAALEVACAKALLALARVELPPMEVARLCQQAEVEFVGMRCGIMDQFASCFGEEGQALLLDCRTLEHERLPLPAGVSLVVANTMVKHALAGSAYNERRDDCEEASRIAGVEKLRDLTEGDLARWMPQWPERVGRRARHIITENARVLRAAEALRTGRLEEFGAEMYSSHESLRDDYEVSCRELDVMVDLARGSQGVYGSRMTGGGFGGCTISLVHRDAVEDLKARLIAGYKAATDKDAVIFVCRAVAGASEERAA
ncbi:MAG: galactokinase [Acidobacteriota bacterium]